MNKTGKNCGKKASLGYQPMPTGGPLGRNRNTTFSNLKAKLSKEQLDAPVYAYVVTTVKLDRATQVFRQEGSAPNFQGQRITLCTCKHKDRSSPPRWDCRGPDKNSPWKGVWVAGICSSTQTYPRALFYLTQIGEAADSYPDLWEVLPYPKAKSATNSPLGDVFEYRSGPKWRASSYAPSHGDHVHAGGVRRADIEAVYYKRRPKLLMGDPKQSYLWDSPSIQFTQEAHDDWRSAHHRFIPKLSTFLLYLK